MVMKKRHDACAIAQRPQHMQRGPVPSTQCQVQYRYVVPAHVCSAQNIALRAIVCTYVQCNVHIALQCSVVHCCACQNINQQQLVSSTTKNTQLCLMLGHSVAHSISSSVLNLKLWPTAVKLPRRSCVAAEAGCVAACCCVAKAIKSCAYSCPTACSLQQLQQHDAAAFHSSTPCAAVCCTMHVIRGAQCYALQSSALYCIAHLWQLQTLLRRVKACSNLKLKQLQLLKLVVAKAVLLVDFTLFQGKVVIIAKNKVIPLDLVILVLLGLVSVS